MVLFLDSTKTPEALFTVEMGFIKRYTNGAKYMNGFPYYYLTNQ